MKPQALLWRVLTSFLLVFCTHTAHGAIQCYDCHGTSSTADFRPEDSAFRNPSTGGIPGNHRTHLSGPSSPGKCGICHPGSTGYTASHRNGSIKLASRMNGSLALTPYNNTTSAFLQNTSPSLASCGNVNCHFERITPTWGSDSSLTTCSTCHGAPPAGNAGNSYAGGAAGSHARHDSVYSGATNCIKCHSDHTGEPKPFAHATSGAKRGLAVQPRTPSNSTSGTYNPVFSPITTYLPSQAAAHSSKLGTCSGTYCHGATMSIAGDRNGGTNITPTWGNAATGQCGTCHGTTSAAPPLRGSHKTHVSSGQATFTPVGGGKPAPPAPAYYYLYGRNLDCTVCHAGYSPKHVNGAAEWRFDRETLPALQGAAYRGISSGSHSPVPAAGYGQCSNLSCHSIIQTATGGPLTGLLGEYKTPTWGNVDDGRCGSCHGADQMHARVYGGMPVETPEISSGSHTRHLQALGTTPGGPARCANCHNYGSSDSLNGCATVCHNSEQNWHATSGVNVAFPPMHSSTTYDGTPQPGDGYGTCNSISCHKGTSARWGSTSCLSCHSVAQGKRAAITSQFASGSHHIQGTVTDAHCYQCHWEANSDGTVNPSYHNSQVSGAAVRLVIYSTGARPRNASRWFISYTANGTRSQIQKISTHCLGCHSDRNNGAQPFGDGKTPRQYAWDGSSVDARYSQTGTTSWGKYTSASFPNAAKKKVTKALSAHGNGAGNQRGWNTVTGVDGAIANTSGGVGVQCYDCHNSHGSAVAGITSRYSSATGRNRGGILKNTQKGYGGYSTTYLPRAAGSAGGKDVRNPGASLCLDCHFSATPTTAPLAVFKGYTTPWGYSSTFNATQPILGYWDSPYMSFGAAVGAKQRYPYKGQNLIKGGHFGASSPLGASIPAENQINGLCTPCHDPHGVSPTLGASGNYAVPLLKGTWLTSPYQEDVAPAGNPDMFADAGTGLPYHIDQNTFGGAVNNAGAGTLSRNDPSLASGLCLGCHSKASLTNGSTHAWKSKDRIHEAVKGWKTANGTNQHSYTCSKCHSAHTSSVLPRLMVTNCLDSPHKGRTSYTHNAMVSRSASDLEGSGSGRIPGVYAGSGICDYPSGPACNRSYSFTCHENNTGAGTNQTWNSVTPWAVAAPPPAPTLTDQTNSISSGGSRNVTLQWSAVICPSGAATHYQVQVSATADFAVIDYSSGWIAATSWTQPLPLGTWYWRVTARDSVDTIAQATSASDSFSILYAAPATPGLTPQSDSISSGGAVAKTFQWSAITPTDFDPMQYLVEVSATADFGVVAQQSGWQAGTSWTGNIPLGTWYWRVTSRDSVHTAAVSTPSASDLFMITYAAPVAPVPIPEPNYSSATDISVTFQWNPVTPTDVDPMQYYVEVSSNASFTVITHQSGWQSGTDWTVTVAPGTWYWRVKCRDSVHTTAVSAPSTTGSFTVTAGPLPPLAPALVPQGDSNSPCTTSYVHTLQWGAVTAPDGHAVQYYAELDTVPSFNSPDLRSSGWTAGTSWTTPALPASNTWYWRVKARDAVDTAQESPYSTTGIFNDTGNWSCECDSSCPSCPILFTWDGKEYAYESDIYPAGKLGNRDPQGFRKPNPYDYYLLASRPEPKEGKYELRLVEEKIEANYLDQVTLYAVDLPADRDIYAERLPITNGKYVRPEEVLHTTAKKLRVPRSVILLETGENLTDRLAPGSDGYVILNRDRNHGFGWKTLEIDPGDLSGAPMIKLIIDGATAFPSTHEGHQIANKWMSKSVLEVQDRQGNWVAVPMKERSLVPRDGGGPIAVDLTKAFKGGGYKFRLKYLYKTYLKSIALDTTTDLPVTVREVALSSGELRYHGYDAFKAQYRGEVLRYIYGTPAERIPSYLPGNYTRFGDVTPLLRARDDKFVIFGSGDEVVLRFEPIADAAPGTSRRFVLYSHGYFKSRTNNNISAMVEPLPFGAMVNFPYDRAVESYPQGPEHQEYLRRYNTRLESGPAGKELKGVEWSKNDAPKEQQSLSSPPTTVPAVKPLAEPAVVSPRSEVAAVTPPAGGNEGLSLLQEKGTPAGTNTRTFLAVLQDCMLQLLKLAAAVWGWIVHGLGR